MRKARIRRIVAEELALRGYSEAHYDWEKGAMLRILVNPDAAPSGNPKLVAARNGFKAADVLGDCFLDFHIVAGGGKFRTRKADLMGMLALVPRRGDAKPVAQPKVKGKPAIQVEAFDQ